MRELFRGPRWKLVLFGAVTFLVLALVGSSAAHAGRVRETRAAIAEIKRGLAAFRADFGRCPHSIDELLHPPRSGRRYLRQEPVDGWGRTLFVRCPGRYEPNGADVISAGPSGSFLDEDNIQ